MMARGELRFDPDASQAAAARNRIVRGLVAALEEAEDGSMTISSLRLANLCGLSWSGNHGTAQALRRMTGVQA